MKAFSLIRRGPEYRSDAFAAGLKACGYQFVEGFPGGAPSRDDVLITWNRYGHFDEVAKIFERCGCQVLVAENGYIGRDKNGQQLYALARNQHNGAGSWHVGKEDRWSALGIELKPWRADGKHVLICAQRGIGSPVTAMPQGWPEGVAARLGELTRRDIRIRLHPETRGLTVEVRPLEDDLRDCWAVVVWGSGAGLKAMAAGIPVLSAMPNWIGSSAAAADLRQVEDPLPYKRDARPQMFHSLAWAQWTLDEIAAGTPFRHLLNRPNQEAA